jgi:hypothetical protein
LLQAADAVRTHLGDGAVAGGAGEISGIGVEAGCHHRHSRKIEGRVARPRLLQNAMPASDARVDLVDIDCLVVVRQLIAVGVGRHPCLVESVGAGASGAFPASPL